MDQCYRVHLDLKNIITHLFTAATKDVTTQSSAFSGINNVPQSGSGNTVKILTIVVTLAIIVLLVS